MVDSVAEQAGPQTVASNGRIREPGLVSIVIPMYNARHWIADAIDGLLAQTYTTWEVIIVDDGSTDDSADVAQKSLASHVDRTLLIRTENLGVSAARNCGMREAKGEFIALLDADDVWEPEKLALQVSSLSDQPGVLACGCGYAIVNEGLQATGRLIVPSWTTNSVYSWLVLRGLGTLLPSTILMRAQVLDIVGFFDERLSTAADLDYSWRLVTSGSVVSLNEILVKYRRSSGQMHRDFSVLQHDYEIMFDSVPVIADTTIQNGIRARLRLLQHVRSAQSGESRLIDRSLLAILLQHPSLFRDLARRQVFRRVCRRGLLRPTKTRNPYEDKRL